MRFPRPLQSGDRIGVTAPSAGVAPALRSRLEVAVRSLESRGYDVVVGDCLGADGVVSAPKAERAAELTAMLADPSIRAVVPPWGGEMAIDLLDQLDWARLADAEPTWLVGFSDLTTVMVPLARHRLGRLRRAARGLPLHPRRGGDLAGRGRRRRRRDRPADRRLRRDRR